MPRLTIGVFAQHEPQFKQYKQDSLPALEEIFPEMECSIVRLRGSGSIRGITSVVFLPGWDFGMTPRRRDEIQHAHALWAAQSMGETDE